MHRAILCLLTIALVVTGEAVADDPQPDQPEPPVRLKKKVRPKTDPAPEPRAEPKTEPKAEPKKDDARDKNDLPEPEPAPEGDEKDTLARIDRNMRASEERLGQKDTGDGTRQIQRDILKDLDSLIQQSRQQQQQQQQQSNQSKSGGSAGSQAQQQQQQQQREQRSASRSRSQRNQSARGQQSEPKNSANQASSGTQAGRGGSSSTQSSNKIADLFKDVWGHLPETMRPEMDAYARDKYMAKYSELLKQYYTTIAEKARQKGD